MNHTNSQEVGLRPVPLSDVSRDEIVDAIANAPAGAAMSFVSVNAHTLYLAEKDEEFREVLKSAWRFCDGFGVHLLAVIQGVPKLRHRNTPTDFMWPVFERLHREGKTVYLLGDEPGVAAQFANQLNSRYPGLVVGARDGFFQLQSDEEKAIVAEIRDRRPHLLCLGMGQPRQEKWANRWRGELGCAAVLNLGASMAFAVGARKRGPQWATDHGLEWLFRVIAEPRKMFSRYFVEIPGLILRALRRH